MLVGTALQLTLHLLHVVDHVLLVIHALRVQLINMEELLQAVLVLAASYVLQAMNAMVLQKQYALQVNTPLQEQQPAHHVPLVLMDPQLALQLRYAVESVQLDTILLQGNQGVQYVRLVIRALKDRLTHMEKLLQAVLVLEVLYARLERIPMQAR
jgi:hypothetical protein